VTESAFSFWPCGIDMLTDFRGMNFFLIRFNLFISIAEVNM